MDTTGKCPYIFYLEVTFGISIFAALASGLNIVVGFAGLLNLIYVAFLFASPESFNFMQSIGVLSMVILGG